MGKYKIIPNIYIYFELGLVFYGFIVNTMLFLSNNSYLIALFSKINTGITVVWLFSNITLTFIFIKKKYEPEAWLFSLYNSLINAFNLSNIYFRYITDYKLLFYFSVTIKVMETIASFKLLYRERKLRIHKINFIE